MIFFKSSISKPIFKYYELVPLLSAEKKDSKSEKKWKFEHGFIKVICPIFKFSQQFMDQVRRIHDNLLTNVPMVYTNSSLVSVKPLEQWTKLDSVVLVIREEYANPYWVLIDLIDIYLALNQSSKTNWLFSSFPYKIFFLIFNNFFSNGLFLALLFNIS